MRPLLPAVLLLAWFGACGVALLVGVARGDSVDMGLLLLVVLGSVACAAVLRADLRVRRAPRGMSRVPVGRSTLT